MTSSVVLSTDAADSEAVQVITAHHQELVETVIKYSGDLLDASSEGSLEGASNSRRDLVLYCRGEILPHAIAEEDTLYALARNLPETRLLVDAMVAEHRILTELIDDLASATTPLAASAAAHAFRVLFEAHAEKENDYLIPALAGSPEVSLAEGLQRMQQEYSELKAAAQGGGCGCGGGGCGGGGSNGAASGGGCGCGSGGGHAEPAGGGCGCGGGGCGGGDDAVPATPEPAPEAHAGCACGGHDAGPERPVLDARQVPHNIRHATVFGALDAVRPGSGLELIAPHDPLPLLGQIEERNPGAFDVSYLERGPEVWRIALDRKVSVDA